MKPVRFGIIGVGGWARGVHIPNLKMIPDAEVAALSSRSEENLRRGIEAAIPSPGAAGETLRTFTDYRELLAWHGVDAVIICSPNHLHKTMTFEALRHGKHVLCEKPLGMTAAEADEIIAARDAAGKVVQVALELRYSDLFRRVKKMVDDGLVGRPVTLFCIHYRDYRPTYGWRMSLEESGGILYELGVHYLDVLTWLSGGAPTMLTASGGKHSQPVDHDHLWCTVTYDNGVSAGFGLCGLLPQGREVRVDILGDRGRIHVDMEASQITFQDFQAGEPVIYTVEAPPDRPVYGFAGTYEQLVEFVQAIRTDAPPAASAEVGRQAAALCEAARKALDGAGMVRL